MIYDAELLELNFEDYHAQSISEHIIPQFKERLENFEIDGTSNIIIKYDFYRSPIKEDPK